MLCDNILEKIQLTDNIIKVDFNIPNSDFHGISNQISINLGIEFNLFCDNFIKIINKCSHIISHNVDFDINVIKNELYRINKNDIIDEINKKKLICTMKNIMNCYKYTSLKELYKYATKKYITNEHNSKHDVINLHEALLLYQNNIFIINDIINYDKIEINNIKSNENNEHILELKKLKLIQLKSKCKECGLTCYSRLNKEQLIKLLNDSNKL
uniref:Exonuclease domain-containing protein n=1 Tax=viral metagenome TaxID=1070528 RepID=A0A6C0H8S5_9ZZZZ